MTTPWQQRYAQRMQRVGSSMIRELLKLTQRPEVISFAGGLPAPELFPVEAIRAATDRVLTQHSSEALQYSTTEGYLPLRQFIVDKMAAYGIRAGVENVLITSGSQQALDLIGKLMVNPGDLILTERPTYLGALQAWRTYQAEFVGVPIDRDGLRLDLLETALSTGPKFMYILPNFQNPGGVTLTLARRRQLLEFADRYGIPIVEDDPYGELRYEGEHVPPLIVLDAERREERPLSAEDNNLLRGNVIYTSTFSKTLAPGLRLAWMVAPTSVIEQCVMVKQGMDLHSSTFTQMVAYEVVRDGFLKEHVRRIRAVYRERRNVMLAALEQHFPEGVRWTEPHGGLFLWVILPPEINATLLLDKAIQNNVAYVPGAAFYPDGSTAPGTGLNTMRLNFSNASPEAINTGIQRLGAVLAEALRDRETFVM